MWTEAKEGEQQTEQTHGISSWCTILQLLLFRFKQPPTNTLHLILVPSELLHPRVGGFMVKPSKQSWDPSRDVRGENEQPRGIPEGHITSEQNGQVSTTGTSKYESRRQVAAR